MQLTHFTDRLILKVLDPSWAAKVCTFYENNKEHFEPFEPKRVPNFYTSEFQRANLSYEYNEFLHFHHLRSLLN